jgi:DNA-binding NtrC family response regulator
VSSQKILLIDDSPDILAHLSEYLTNEGYDVETSTDARKAIPLIERKFYDIILTDLMMPHTDGMEVLKYATKHSHESICIILTGYGTIKNAVEAVKLGAFD